MEMPRAAPQPLSRPSGRHFTETSRWTACVRRDAAASEAFVYAVKTTGIYCRPNCSSRLARRANVEFYNNASDAEEAGFRACKRCKPENKSHDPEARVRRKVDQAVVSLKTAAEKGKRVGLNELSNTIGVSKWHLRREFLRITGLSPYQMASILLNPVSAQRDTWLGQLNETLGLADRVADHVCNPNAENTRYGSSGTSSEIPSLISDHEAVAFDDPLWIVKSEYWSTSSEEATSHLLQDLFPEVFASSHH
ncbi:unnamed protein product [Aureobasidium pullulans]|nr:hypothetical protein D6D00_07796 [Aureobasidium pullulans]THY98124.1 hypothetical protein D6C92_03048 [Aureobasidium pullulans]TIA18475.1 hypothetical protein D6C81_05073 [Aureobasidium pullulans]CAD0053908.1 unnamed protein product [Aureobasidium pullulans]